MNDFMMGLSIGILAMVLIGAACAVVFGYMLGRRGASEEYFEEELEEEDPGAQQKNPYLTIPEMSHYQIRQVFGIPVQTEDGETQFSLSLTPPGVTLH